MTSSSNKNTPLAWAASYIERGFAPIPVASNGKIPTLSDWTNAKITAANIADVFKDQTLNIGVLLGAPSGDIVDVDLDCPEAVQLADYLLPSTNMIFGRKSTPRCHRIYRTKLGSNRVLFALSDSGTLVELRADRHFTVFPGSKYDKDHVVFQDDGEPAEVEPAVLKQAVTAIAIGCVLARHWKPGHRHQLALCISGCLANCGWAREDVRSLIEAVARMGNDLELKDRLRCVETTFDTFDAGRAVQGFGALEECIGHGNSLKIRTWVVPSVADNKQLGSAGESLATEAGAAEEFAGHSTNELVYCSSTQNWYRRCNKLYFRVGEEIVQGLAMGFLKDAAEKASPELKRKLRSRGRINATVELARHYLSVEQDQLDAEFDLVGCKDGTVIDLLQGTLCPDVSAKLTKRLGTTFDSVAQCPTWLRFLNRIFDNNSDLIDFVQRAVGYSLTGHVDDQCLFLLIGDGANGKTTFLKVMQRLFGDYSATTPMQTLTVQRGEQSNDLARLVGKRFVSASEGEPGQKLAESKVKLMTGGDPITCRWLYQEFFEFVPQFKLWVATNNLPKVVGTDNAIWRRLHVIRFPVTIPEQERDPRLADRMFEELPGILRWSLKGLKQWREQGLNVPTVVRDETQAYQLESDSIGQFIETCCICEPGRKTTTKKLYDHYEQWCQQSCLEPVAKPIFGRTMARKGFEPYRLNTGNGWRGIQVDDLKAA